MTKVLVQINVCRNNGSTGRINEQIGVLAQKRGWECYIVHGPRCKNSSQLISIEVVNRIQENWHAIMTRLFDMHGLVNILATRRLVQRIRKIHPDVVHLHNIHGYYINYKVLFKYLKDAEIPVVWTLHDCWNFTGHCAHFDFEGCERWKVGCHSCPLKESYPASVFFDGSRRNYRIKKKYFTAIEKNLILVPVSYWLEEMVKQSFLKNCNTQTIYNGIDINIFSPQSRNDIDVVRNKYSINSNKVVLGCATSWGKKKGYQDYFALRKHVHFDVTIILVGLSASEIIEVNAAGMVGIGRTEDMHELACLYSLADVVLNLSYEETFGLTTVEGFACGTPGIVYNRTALPELITPETGLCVQAGDIKSVEDAVCQLLAKGKLFFRNACRKRAEEYYNKDICFSKYIDLYENLYYKSNHK